MKTHRVTRALEHPTMMAFAIAVLTITAIQAALIAALVEILK